MEPAESRDFDGHSHSYVADLELDRLRLLLRSHTGTSLACRDIVKSFCELSGLFSSYFHLLIDSLASTKPVHPTSDGTGAQLITERRYLCFYHKSQGATLCEVQIRRLELYFMFLPDRLLSFSFKFL